MNDAAPNQRLQRTGIRVLARFARGQLMPAAEPRFVRLRALLPAVCAITLLVALAASAQPAPGQPQVSKPSMAASGGLSVFSGVLLPADAAPHVGPPEEADFLGEKLTFQTISLTVTLSVQTACNGASSAEFGETTAKFRIWATDDRDGRLRKKLFKHVFEHWKHASAWAIKNDDYPPTHVLEYYAWLMPYLAPDNENPGATFTLSTPEKLYRITLEDPGEGGFGVLSSFLENGVGFRVFGGILVAARHEPKFPVSKFRKLFMKGKLE